MLTTMVKTIGQLLWQRGSIRTILSTIIHSDMSMFPWVSASTAMVLAAIIRIVRTPENSRFPLCRSYHHNRAPPQEGRGGSPIVIGIESPLHWESIIAERGGAEADCCVSDPASEYINLRPAGGVFEHPPCGFFADSKKTAARSAAGFSPTLSPVFLATFVKVSILGHARSGHQVRSSDHTLQKLYNRAPATVFEGRLWNFRNMISSSVPTKCISRFFYIGDLRSGHFRDLPIISQWAKIKLSVLCFMLSLYELNRIR